MFQGKPGDFRAPAGKGGLVLVTMVIPVIMESRTGKGFSGSLCKELDLKPASTEEKEGS